MTASRNIREQHGLTETPEYLAWCDMKKRCYVKNSNRYYCYGARGIIVCEQWRKSFLTFLNDLGFRPSDEHSLDRIDNNGNYEPKNCKWSTRIEQRRNTSINRYITMRGITKTLSEWAIDLKMDPETLSNRIKAKWPITRIMNEPVGSYRPTIESASERRDLRRVEYKGEQKLAAEWGRQFGLRSGTILTRIDILGWSVEKALTTPIMSKLCLR